MVAQLTEYSKLLHHSSPSKLCEWRYMTCTIPRKRAPEEADMPTSSYWPLPRSELYRWPGGGGGGGGAPKTQKRKNPKNAADTMSEATAIVSEAEEGSVLRRRVLAARTVAIDSGGSDTPPEDSSRGHQVGPEPRVQT